MAVRVPPGIADYLVVLLSPVLIISMIVSLVFFLIDVLYVGQYAGRLLWTMFFFIGAAVLIARIAIEIDATRARLYGLILAVIVLIALNRFIEFAPGGPFAKFSWLINLGLMALVWWSANQLTWDCTHIDEKREASDQGLVAAAGFESGSSGKELRRQARGDSDAPVEAEVDDDRPNETGPTSWIRRYQRHRARQAKKPHTPGVWVIYFSLAAFPLFGLGQSLIPASSPERRSWAFQLMTVYLASGLGLLLTTSFLGLRHYLRKRNLEMPTAMTGMWIGVGASIVAVCLLVSAFLPRPQSETPLVQLSYLSSKDREASQNAMMSGDTGKGEGKVGKQQMDPSAKNSVQGKKGPAEYEGKSDQQSNDSKSDQQSDSSKGSKQPQSSKSEKSNGAKGKATADQSKNRKGDQSKEQSESKSGGNPSDSDDQENAESNQSGQSGSTTPPSSPLSNILANMSSWLKWILYALIVLAVIGFFLFRGLGWLSQFIPGLRRLYERILAWWASLFGRGGEVVGESMDDAPQRIAVEVPFRSFVNPFATGAADSESIGRLLAYSFQALEAWGRESGCPRNPSETAGEYLQRLIAFGEAADFSESFRQACSRFATVYQRQAYASRVVARKSALDILRQFWDALDEHPPVQAVTVVNS
ncbi:DUF4129 domain-containing protein [Tuwongella immobilis]|uniref:Protein-glutamine gamma-glutamyltransferase-like C-terminal domain-containing protein n=1 Tax=Tuwongella immobilis TaxID=692036 RepID=A0A6C2YQN4_9BACT|nr:DUF4129 domain-containing protein [Tuwongella immobilis]VIP03704.1 Uncharacterized protein OS=Blastopirellula marina DSM 3645 GN=DSM3645_01811 PE=4 SV=1: DUF4129 [Tuwongella immobilis]VTS04776.1 Uncharacterized protein OS=Blastopirellula marina DSM 3645 GN=DSM3645_01811 PE=4 SV=1: DUF4129 [Tuwongella immobilis]